MSRRARTTGSIRSIPYALSKYQGEQACFHWHHVYRLPVNSIRIFNAYGTRSRTSGAYGAVFGVFLKQKLEGKPFTVVGDGTQSRDFLYVTDVARVLLAAETAQDGRDLQPRGRAIPRRSIGWSSCSADPVVHIPKRPGEPDCTWADITKIKTQLGWAQQINFEEGVQRILDNIEYWRNAPLWDPETIAKATKTWFVMLSSEGTIKMDQASKGQVGHKIKTVEQLCAIIGPRPRQKKGDHVPRHV